MSVKLQLSLFSLISLLFILIVGGVGLYSEGQMAAALENSSTASLAIRNQLEADMMHDALRGDVLAAGLAALKNQQAKRQDIEKDMAEHMKVFRNAFKENNALMVSPSITAEIGKVQPIVETYIAESKALVNIAFSKPAELEARLVKFLESFNLLEKEMSRLSDMIEKKANETKLEAVDRAAFFKRLVFGTMLVAAAALALLAAMVVRLISGNVAAVFDAVDHLNNGNGDLGYRLPNLSGEFGRLGGSLNVFLASID